MLRFRLRPLLEGERWMPRVFPIAVIEALGMLLEMAIRRGENQCHDYELKSDLQENRRNEISRRHRVSAEGQCNADDEQDGAAQPKIEFQNAKIEREDHRPDKLMAEGHAALILTVAASYDEWMPMLLQNFFHFGVAQRPSEF